MTNTSEKILVIDDEPDIVKILETRLKSQGFEIIGSTSALDGLVSANTQDPDLILLDLLMPEKNGIEITKLLQSDDKTRGIPIIFITATLDKAKDKQDTEIEVGGVSYPAFAKPIHTPKLLSVIRKLLKKTNE